MLEQLLQPNDVNERCGLVLSDGTIVEIVNIAEKPEDSYEMDPLGVIPFLSMAEATWHTHPNGTNILSGADYEGFKRWPDLRHHVIGKEGVRSYYVDGEVVRECN